MNTFKTSFIGNLSVEQKQKYIDKDGGCEHAEADANKAAYFRTENDSFGIVGSYACCEECNKKADEEEDNETYVCTDCKETKPQKDGTQWKWYDFYAAQGDVPLFVCNCCRTKDKHLARIAADQRAYKDEFGEDEDNDIHDCDCDECRDR